MAWGKSTNVSVTGERSSEKLICSMYVRAGGGRAKIMIPRLFQNWTILMGSAFILLTSFIEATDEGFPMLLNNMAFHHEGRRNPKFIIPSLLSHIYQKTDGDSVMNSILYRPFSKKVGKEADPSKKEGTSKSLEHRPIIGNNKKEHLSEPKTKSPNPKLIESPENQGEETKTGKEGENRQNGVNDGPIEVKRGFSGFRKWYGASPMIWAPPIPFPNSYLMPYQQIANSPTFSSYHESRLPNPIENLYIQGGVVHKPLSGDGVLDGKVHIRAMNGDSTNSEDGPKSANSKSNTMDASGPDGWTDFQDKNLVSQERKFVITNVTKYVLDFYCPHCGGEISVSRAKNKGTHNRVDDITVNKGIANAFNKMEDVKNKFLHPSKTKT